MQVANFLRELPILTNQKLGLGFAANFRRATTISDRIFVKLLMVFSPNSYQIEFLRETGEPTIGQRFEVKQNDGTIIFRITDIKDNTVTLDANHPLAGQTLKLDVEMVEIMR